MDKRSVCIKEIIYKRQFYSSSPEDIALNFEKMGADYLHVVDLDGAKEGTTTNLETIQKIRKCFIHTYGTWWRNP